MQVDAAYRADRDQLTQASAVVADGVDVKRVIASGLKLSKKGLDLVQKSLSEEDTKKGMGQLRAINRLWQQGATAATGHDYDYVAK